MNRIDFRVVTGKLNHYLVLCRNAHYGCVFFWGGHDHVLQVDALGKVFPCGPFGRILWGQVLGITARCAGCAGQTIPPLEGFVVVRWRG